MSTTILNNPLNNTLPLSTWKYHLMSQFNNPENIFNILIYFLFYGWQKMCALLGLPKMDTILGLNESL